MQKTACAWGLVNHVYAPEELLSKAQNLATDMATIDGEFLKAYKQLIFDGFDRNFKDALALEKQTTDAWNDNVSAAEVEERRQSVIARGRKLKG